VSRQRVEALARDFDLETSGFTSSDWHDLFEMLRWLDAQTPPRTVSRRTYTPLWDEFQNAP
jgi:hypothetical protein